MHPLKRLPFVLGLVLAWSPLLLAGCGGGSNVRSTGRANVGTLVLTIEFPPQPTAVDTAAIPAVTNSFRVHVTDLDTGTPLQADVIAARVAGATQTVQITGLRAGDVGVDAWAYKTADGSGDPIAQGYDSGTVVAGQQTVVKVVLAVLPEQVVIPSPTPLEIEVGSSRVLNAVAYDADGNIIPDATFAWSSSDNATASVDDTGNVEGKAAGTCTITATETTTGIQGTIQVTVGEGGEKNYTVYGTRGGERFRVDDNIDIYINGEKVYDSGMGGAFDKGPATFKAKQGDTLHFEIRDTYGMCCNFSALYIRDDQGHSALLHADWSQGCGNPGGDQGVQYTYDYVIPF